MPWWGQNKKHRAPSMDGQGSWTWEPGTMQHIRYNHIKKENQFRYRLRRQKTLNGRGRAREWEPCIDGKVKRRRGFFMVGLAGDSRPRSRQGMGDNKTFMAASGQGDRKPCMGRGGRLYALGTLHKRGMTGVTGVPKGAKQG